MDNTKSAVTTRILEKGPEYLRKQMDREGEIKGRPSAVERLAASKPHYVKSQQQQVDATKLDSVPVVTFSSASVSSSESSNRSSNRSTNKLRSIEQEIKDSRNERSPPEVIRRSSSKKQRPDSILVHRQRCESTKGPTNENTKGRLIRRFFHSPLRDKTSALPVEAVQECDLKGKGAEPTQSEKTGNTTHLRKEVKKKVERLDKPRVGVHRSHSDISSRYSKNFSEFDTFFKYCGLDSEIVECLGKENFSARSDELSVKIRSVSVSTSDDGFTRKSDEMDDGLFEEDLTEKNRQNTSVIERNARIIKWLYSCKNANDSGKVLRDLQ